MILVLLPACTDELAPARPFPEPPPGTLPPGLGKPAARTPDIGWTLLGGRTLEGITDREEFVTAEGPACEQVRIAVTRGQAELEDVGISFTDGQRFEPRGPMVFDALTRERVIALPGGRRELRQIDFRVRRISAEPLEVVVSGR